MCVCVCVYPVEGCMPTPSVMPLVLHSIGLGTQLISVLLQLPRAHTAEGQT